MPFGTGVWPQHSALDHGNAGHLQRSARRLAARVGLAEEYARAQTGQESWISDIGHERVGRDGILRDTPCPCPFGCARAGKRVFSLLGVCPRRRKIARLILLERARRLELQAFWESVRENDPGLLWLRTRLPLSAGRGDATRCRTASPNASRIAQTLDWESLLQRPLQLLEPWPCRRSAHASRPLG